MGSVRRCRACGAGDLIPWFDLGTQPLANNLLERPSPATPEYPLAVLRCPVCHLSQLSHVVDPGLLFTNYLYRSGVSAGWHRHCQGLVAIVQEHFIHAEFILDIAANDGTLLKQFDLAGYRVLGVDPAVNIASSAPVPIVPSFWNRDTAASVVSLHGKADIIIAQNVLGHVEDAVGFLRAAKHALNRGGVLLVEVPRFPALLDFVAFDTIYHEHLSYWSVTPLRYVAERAGLTLCHIDTLAIHGGSYRCWFRHAGPVDQTVWDQVAFERKLSLESASPYTRFQARVSMALRRLGALLDRAAEDKKNVVGYGAAAKATVMLNEMQRQHLMLPRYVMDDSTAKQGRFIPGVNLAIEPPSQMDKVDILLVFPWNWAEEIMARARTLDFTGKFLIPLPYPRMV